MRRAVKATPIGAIRAVVVRIVYGFAALASFKAQWLQWRGANRMWGKERAALWRISQHLTGGDLGAKRRLIRSRPASRSAVRCRERRHFLRGVDLRDSRSLRLPRVQPALHLGLDPAGGRPCPNGLIFAQGAADYLRVSRLLVPPSSWSARTAPPWRVDTHGRDRTRSSETVPCRAVRTGASRGSIPLLATRPPLWPFPLPDRAGRGSSRFSSRRPRRTPSRAGSAADQASPPPSR
jgi:hypothetical protein